MCMKESAPQRAVLSTLSAGSVFPATFHLYTPRTYCAFGTGWGTESENRLAMRGGAVSVT